MGRGTEAVALGVLAILGTAAKFGVNLSMDKIPVTEDTNVCALVATDVLNLRRVPTTLDNNPIGGPLRKDTRLPYVGSITRVTGENVDPNRSDGNQWYMLTTTDGHTVYASAVFSSNSCPDRFVATETR